MVSRTSSRLLLLFTIFAGWTASSQASVQDRIAGAIQSENRVALAHTVSPRALQAADLGAAPTSQKLDGMTMRFSLTDAQKTALDKLLRDQQDPNSPRYRQWLTPQQFGAQFGLSAADLAKVSSWLTGQGLTISAVANSGTFITFSGTIGQVQQAFGTSIHRLSVNGEDHIANLTEPMLPAAIAGVVANITGLNDFRLKSRARRVVGTDLDASRAHPRDTINTSKGLLHYIAPGDFYTIYNVNPLVTSGTNGNGVSIAVMGQVDLNTGDVAAFRTASGLTASTISVKTYGADPGSPTTACLGSSPPSNCVPSADDLAESQLDVEWAGAVAPSASIIFVNSTDVLGISLAYAIDNNIASIMTVSYGNCETAFGLANAQAFDNLFAQANAQGITVLGPTGDSGATDCDNGVQVATQGLSVDFPASSPHVTAVGGTQFSEGLDNTSNPGKYWNNTVPSTSASSALSYIPEAVWNETASDIANFPTTGRISAGGGGASIYFTKPVWQTGTGVPADSKRDTPDVSLSAAAQHDPYLVCFNGSCTGGTFFASSGAFNAFGGTSVSTPAFAGVLALVEQKLGGARLGNANPYIYSLANSGSYASIFHDVTAGDNKSPCKVGTPGCTTSPIGFSAGTGYDQATGWGSVDTTQLATSFSTVAVNLPGTTTMTLAPSSSTTTIGGSVTFTATVGHTGAATPTGTVLFFVDQIPNAPGAVISGSVPLTAGGTAVYTSTFPGCGTHTIFAVYNSGDNNYYGASTSTTVVVGTSACTMTVAGSPASFTIASGGSITSTITVTSVGGFAGAVTLNASSSSLNGSPSFMPSTVTLTSGGSATSTFTVMSLAVASARKGTTQLKRSGGVSSLALGGGATLAGLLLFGLGGKRRRGWTGLFALLVFAALSAGVGCSSSSTPAPTPPPPVGGTYQIAITASDVTTGTIVATTNLSVTIH